MPALDEIKSSWADEVEQEGEVNLPPPTETFENGFKILTEYKLNDEGQVVKIVRTYKVEKRLVSKTVAKRKNWHKFGDSHNDKPGPNPATTIVSEEITMLFITNKEEDNKVDEDSAIDKLKGLAEKGVVKCRNCGGDHWTLQCPFKDTVLAGGKIPEEKSAVQSAAAATQEQNKPGGSKYVAPSLREGASGKRDTNSSMLRRDDMCAIRISNLSESTTEQDLEELVKQFGQIQKLFLAKDKQTNLCKGFAYVHFKVKADAALAIQTLNGFGYDHLILNADWSKPQTHSNQ